MTEEDKPAESTTTTEETTKTETTEKTTETPKETKEEKEETTTTTTEGSAGDDDVDDTNETTRVSNVSSSERSEDDNKLTDSEHMLKDNLEETVKQIEEKVHITKEEEESVGRDKKNDVYATSLESGMMIYKKLIADANDKEEIRINKINEKNAKSKKPKEPLKNKWNLEYSPYKQFNKTLDDVYVSFLKWSNKSTNPALPKINVSKAFRRLESYANWFTKKHVTDLTNLTAESIEPSYKLFNMKVTISKDKQFVWWFDMTTVDIEDIKSISIIETFRLFVWISHVAMFSSEAQDNGMIMYFNPNKTGFIQLMKLFPLKLSMKLDKLTIGVLPVKMKTLYLMDTPKWMSIIINMIKPFVTKKIRQRLVVLNKPNLIGDMKSKLGEDCIPSSFAVLDGKASSDKDDYIINNYLNNITTHTATIDDNKPTTTSESTGESATSEATTTNGTATTEESDDI